MNVKVFPLRPLRSDAMRKAACQGQCTSCRICWRGGGPCVDCFSDPQLEQAWAISREMDAHPEIFPPRPESVQPRPRREALVAVLGLARTYGGDRPYFGKIDHDLRIQRDQLMFFEHARGSKTSHIARRYGLSPARVGAILRQRRKCCAAGNIPPTPTVP